MLASERVVIAPDEGAVILGGGVGFVGKLYGEENGGAFAIGEHPLEPGILAAPPHTHANEDQINSRACTDVPTTIRRFPYGRERVPLHGA